MTFPEFCERLRSEEAYIGPDNHMHRKDGRRLSHPCTNGYYMVRKMYDGKNYYFMEHRVIWYYYYGDIDENKVINHKDFDRGNNAIENLELVTQKENVAYSMNADRFRWLKGPESPKALFSEKEVQFIRYLCQNGYKQKDVAKMMDVKNVNVISRVVTGARYGNVMDASSIISIYPLLVEKTRRSDLPFQDQVINAVMGLCGETGEVVDLVKKTVFQGHPLDVNHMVEELGDVLYYLTWLAILFDIDISEIAFENMAKLNERYPNGFDPERSIHREV
jgi:NTP pyrophosphatase (non-canonical NTP hydrolase)